MKWFRIIFLSFFLLIVMATIALDSNPGKKFLETRLLNAIASSGLEVESVSGNLPYHIHLKNLDVQGVHFDEVDLEISLIYLLKQELYIKSLRASGLKLPPSFQASTSGDQKLPVTISIHSFDIQGDLNLRGKGRIQKNGAGFISAHASRSEFQDAEATVDLSWDAKREGKVNLHCNTPTLKAFAPWIKTSQEGSLELNVEAKGSPDHFTGKLNGHFFEDQKWTFHTHFHKEQSLYLKQVVVSSDMIHFEGHADLDESLDLIKGDGDFTLHLLQGTVLGDLNINKVAKGLRTQINYRSEELNIEDYQLTKVAGKVEGLYANEAFIGQTNLSAHWLSEEWTATSPIAIRPKFAILFENIQLQSSLSLAKGNLSYRIPEKDFIGQLNIEQADLRLINRANDTLPILHGLGTGSLRFEQPGFFADIEGNQVYYENAYAEVVTFHKEPQDIKITVSNGQWKGINLEFASLDSSQNMVHFKANGSLREPFEVDLTGTYEKNQLTMATLDGELASDSFHLSEPMTLSWGPNFVDCTPTSIRFGDGLLFFAWEQNPKSTNGRLNASNIPLKIFSLNPQDVPISGQLFIEGTFQEDNGQSSGEITGRIQNGLIALEGSPESLALQGDFDAKLQKNHLKTSANITINQNPYLSLDVDLPVTIDAHQFKIHPIRDRKIEGSISLHGRIEEVVDYINIGTHRIAGTIDCEMKLKGKLNKPLVDGVCIITDGVYQNYLSGTDLLDINGSIKGVGDQLVLQKFTAQDNRQGSIAATGIMNLTPANYFPFQIGVDFSKFEILQLDLIRASAVGKIWIKGSLKEAAITGTTEITQAEVTIPSKVPRSFPDLKVVYKNAPNPAILNKIKKEKPFPLNLDLRVLAPKGISIDGRGLHSEWKGDFLIGGNYKSPAVEGKLELVQGEFSFSGKQFKLMNGSINMQGKPLEMPEIDISANTSEKGVSITARIKGPINTPQITFQSSPPLPLSSIISYLIFGKDLGDVSGLQALQLATTVASVAGEGPDVLEMTRKSLGVDRLQIVMTPSSMDEGADTISLEIGKVIIPGFYVAIRQGAEDDSPNIRVEVDLTHGFTLGVESQQMPEQGKFSLNWNYNY